MRGWDALPNHRLLVSGEASAQFLTLDIEDYRDAARFVNQLPHGRNADRADFRLVISERCGTCYLTYSGERIDVTRVSAFSPLFHIAQRKIGTTKKMTPSVSALGVSLLDLDSILKI